MGYIFEHLIRRFNEQANEEAGDHFTPREVITLMAHLMYTKDENVYKEHITKTIYDPARGTGGTLSVSEEYIRNQNRDARLMLYGQDHNDESWVICCSDMFIKGESVANIALGDTLGDGKSFDRHPEKKFDYMMANPPFGVDWKDQHPYIQKEHEQFGFAGCFGPGLPRINDGSLLFLPHMLSKRRLAEDEVWAFRSVWFGKRGDAAGNHQKLNAILDQTVERFIALDEKARELFRGKLNAFRKLYAFLSQIIPYGDSELEMFYAYSRFLLTGLPAPDQGPAFALDAEVALRFYRLEKLEEGTSTEKAAVGAGYRR